MIKLHEYRYDYTENIWKVNGILMDSFYCLEYMFTDIEKLVDNEYMTKEQAYDYMQGTMLNMMILLNEYGEKIKEK